MLDDADEAFVGFFCLHFSPAEKSAKVAVRRGSQLGEHSSSSTPGACAVANALESLDDFWVDEADGMWMRLPSGR